MTTTSCRSTQKAAAAIGRLRRRRLVRHEGGTWWSVDPARTATGEAILARANYRRSKVILPADGLQIDDYCHGAEQATARSEMPGRRRGLRRVIVFQLRDVKRVRMMHGTMIVYRIFCRSLRHMMRLVTMRLAAAMLAARVLAALMPLPMVVTGPAIVLDRGSQAESSKTAVRERKRHGREEQAKRIYSGQDDRRSRPHVSAQSDQHVLIASLRLQLPAYIMAIAG
jgi:hypothetical protein